MNQLFRLPIAKHAGWWVAVVLVCGAFALKVLGLIDATTLGSDELYTVGKSFQGLRRSMGDASVGHLSASLILASVALGCSSWAKRRDFAAVVLACLWLGRCGDSGSVGVFGPATSQPFCCWLLKRISISSGLLRKHVC